MPGNIGTSPAAILFYNKYHQCEGHVHGIYKYADHAI